MDSVDARESSGESAGIQRGNLDPPGPPRGCARRLLGLAPEAQKHVFDLFQAVLEATVEAAKREGRYDDGIVDVSGTSILLTAPPATVRQVRGGVPGRGGCCGQAANDTCQLTSTAGWSRNPSAGPAATAQSAGSRQASILQDRFRGFAMPSTYG